MSNSTTLLPRNATPQERALEAATARLADVPVPIIAMASAETCPESLLPWLAWAFSVDEFDARWAEEDKRNAIQQSITVHRRKGTVGAVKLAIQAAGYDASTLTEGDTSVFHDGEHIRDGSVSRGDPNRWATYRLELTRPITIVQAAQVRKLADAAAPARSHLIEIRYTQALHLHDGSIVRNGTYTRGVA